MARAYARARALCHARGRPPTRLRSCPEKAMSCELRRLVTVSTISYIGPRLGVGAVSRRPSGEGNSSGFPIHAPLRLGEPQRLGLRRRHSALAAHDLDLRDAVLPPRPG